MENYSVDEPIYALATAYAPSALAVVRTSGKGSIGMLAGAFSPSSRLVRAANGTLVHGHVLDEDGTTIDEVVLSVYREGHGYTGEEAVDWASDRLSGASSPSAPSCTEEWTSRRQRPSRRS